MSNNKQSSLEWLENLLKDRYPLMNSEPIFEQAKEMHKEEIEQSYMSGAYDKATIFEEAQTYYTKTFGQRSKYYSEKEVRRILSICDEMTIDECLEDMTIIELPTDDEIEEGANIQYAEQDKSFENSTEMFPFDDSALLKAGFVKGVNWTLNKIKGGDNE